MDKAIQNVLFQANKVIRDIITKPNLEGVLAVSHNDMHEMLFIVNHMTTLESAQLQSVVLAVMQTHVLITSVVFDNNKPLLKLCISMLLPGSLNEVVLKINQIASQSYAAQSRCLF